MTKTFLTKKGYNKLLKELKKLKEIDLPNILEKLKEAIAQGDISENAEYDTAMSDKEITEARINEIENILNNLEIIEEQKGGEIRYGSTVIIKDEKGKSYELTIVGTNEADILDNTISFKSPVGRAIMGKKKGDKVKVNAPQKKYTITITNVK